MYIPNGQPNAEKMLEECGVVGWTVKIKPHGSVWDDMVGTVREILPGPKLRVDFKIKSQTLSDIFHPYYCDQHA